MGVLFVLLILPRGLGGLVFSIRDQFLRMVALRKGIVVPSLLADSRVEGPEPEDGPLPGGLPSAPAKVAEADDGDDESAAESVSTGGVT